jgi:hypothetical protein
MSIKEMDPASSHVHKEPVGLCAWQIVRSFRIVTRTRASRSRVIS